MWFPELKPPNFVQGYVLTKQLKNLTAGIIQTDSMCDRFIFCLHTSRCILAYLHNCQLSIHRDKKGNYHNLDKVVKTDLVLGLPMNIQSCHTASEKSFSTGSCVVEVTHDR